MEGGLLEEVRARVGPRCLIACSFDLHGVDCVCESERIVNMLTMA